MQVLYSTQCIGMNCTRTRDVSILCVKCDDGFLQCTGFNHIIPIGTDLYNIVYFVLSVAGCSGRGRSGMMTEVKKTRNEYKTRAAEILYLCFSTPYTSSTRRCVGMHGYMVSYVETSCSIMYLILLSVHGEQWRQTLC